MNHQGFGFCEFMSEQDAEYAVKIMNQIKLYGKPIRVNKASYDKKQLDVGANLFIGNLDENVDENALYDTFATFGAIAEHPKVSGGGLDMDLDKDADSQIFPRFPFSTCNLSHDTCNLSHDTCNLPHHVALSPRCIDTLPPLSRSHATRPQALRRATDSSRTTISRPLIWPSRT
jgi:RNA recognition motif-containing protein